MIEEEAKHLTRRETEVRDKLCLGWSNRQIADAMGISLRTVETYRANIFDKMKVRNAVELVRAVYHIEEMV